MMHSIDMHCDTLMAAAMKNVEDLSKADLREMPGCSIDFKRLHEARAMAQCFAIFFPPQEGLRQRSGLTDEQYLTACHQVFTQSLERTNELAGGVTSQMSIVVDAVAEQTTALGQVTDGIDQISSVVQTNSATSEQSAAASEELSSQANLLRDLVSTFRLRQNGRW